MKTYLAACAGVLLLVAGAVAIPQTFQQPANIFVRTAGVSFEDFATDPGSWDANTGLKGHWVAQGDNLMLADTAAVFGVPADQVIAEKAKGHIESFTAVFLSVDKKTGRSRDVAGQLLANVRAFTGTSGQGDTKHATFDFKESKITLLTEGKNVVVRFTH